MALTKFCRASAHPRTSDEESAHGDVSPPTKSEDIFGICVGCALRQRASTGSTQVARAASGFLEASCDHFDWAQ
eukprot:1852266-Amphidinium_carterae.1